MKVKCRDIILKHTSSSLLLLPHIKPCHLFSRGDIFILALPGGLWCLSSPTKDQTRAPAVWKGRVFLLDHQRSP